MSKREFHPSQEKQILSWMLEGKPITPIDALNLCGCFRLGARIKDLKDKGYNIITRMVVKGDKRFAEYRLDGYEG